MKNFTKAERSRRVINKDMYLILPFFQNFLKYLSPQVTASESGYLCLLNRIIFNKDM
jgi:hypothetical protein